MPVPVARTYKSGSIIYFENDKASEIYVLKSGSIMLTSTSLIEGDDVKENVGKGQFFGVRPVLGHYKREETAQVLTDSTILVFDLHSFGALCLKNPRIVLQMLKSFSANLRKVHGAVRSILGQKESSDYATELMQVAEYYYQQDQKDYAIYAFEKYKENYPSSPLYQRAEKMLSSLKQGLMYPADTISIDEELHSSNDGMEF